MSGIGIIVIVHSQLVDEVVAEILSDVFVPGLPHACHRGRSRSGHATQVGQAVVQQTARRSNRIMRRERDRPLQGITNRGFSSNWHFSYLAVLPLRIDIAVHQGIRQQVGLLVLRLHTDAAVHSHGVSTW